MLRIFFFTAFLTPFTLFAFATTASSSTLATKRLIFLGDSLTEGYGVAQAAAYPQIIKEKFKQTQLKKIQLEIKTSGASGATSASTLSYLQQVAKDKQTKPDIVFILMGSNDGLRGIKTEETEKNLSKALIWAQKKKIKVILGQLHIPPNYGKDYAEKFANIFPRLAKKHKISLAPFLLDGVAGVAKLNQEDGIHPNELGHQVIADNIYEYLVEYLAKEL